MTSTSSTKNSSSKSTSRWLLLSIYRYSRLLSS